jgi:hypothetical protein
MVDFPFSFDRKRRSLTWDAGNYKKRKQKTTPI